MYVQICMDIPVGWEVDFMTCHNWKRGKALVYPPQISFIVFFPSTAAVQPIAVVEHAEHADHPLHHIGSGSEPIKGNLLDGSSVGHYPHDTAFAGDFHQFFMPAEEHTHRLPTSFPSASGMNLREAGWLRGKRTGGGRRHLGVMRHAFVSR
jgi:hypothetical protein